MTLLEIIQTILIGPLKMLFETIFSFVYRLTGSPGLSIIFLSLIMNVMVLPLYMSADATQEKARLKEASLHDGITHIKKTFKGDERMMMLQTYYKQNGYSPLQSLSGSISLLLEIPFFIAAYQFLAHLTLFNGSSFGPIHNLGAPDAMFSIGSFDVNMLPIIMTAFNILASILYLKGAPLKSKIQLYTLATFFLVFLYTSPAGLVFYWTLNNLFSLIKNIFYKLKNPKKVLKFMLLPSGFVLLVLSLIFVNSAKARRFMCIGSILLQIIIFLVYIIKYSKKYFPKKLFAKINFKFKFKFLSKKNSNETKIPQPSKKTFVLGCVFLSLLIGLLIPSACISASPQEFVFVGDFMHPIWYIVSSFCIAIGLFLVWFQVFYFLASTKYKIIFERTIWIVSIVMLVNYLFFGTKLGIISSTLKYEKDFYFSILEQVINLLVIGFVSLVVYLFFANWKKATSVLCLVAIVSASIMLTYNTATIFSSVNAIDKETLQSKKEDMTFNMSTNGKNVVVIMLDRAISSYLPYIMNEKPELKEIYSGFTFYSNSISYGCCTNIGAPALLGGYEYTPVELNKRDTESLVKKTNEANLVLPVLFKENGFDTTVSDPIYLNYNSISDLSVFNDYPGIKAFNASGAFDEDIKEIQKLNLRNFPYYSIMKTLPLSLQLAIYEKGHYCNETGSVTQAITTTTTAVGKPSEFLSYYNVLDNLPQMTQIKESDQNTFLFMSNMITHAPCLLQKPNYELSDHVDNSEFDCDGVILDDGMGNTQTLTTIPQISHYHANMASLLVIGEWLQYLKENNIYDNTRIILVSDHGRDLSYREDLIMPEGDDLCWYQSFLMVKDFNQTEFKTSNEFMTNADVPTIATKDLIENPINPFTGKSINSDEKTAHPQYICLSDEWNVNVNCGKTFLPSGWASVEGDLWDKNNWKFYYGKTVLKSHTAP